MTETNNQANITVYSTEFCGFCKMVKKFLDEHNIKYADIDVGRDEEAAKKMIEKSGQQGVPVIIVEKDGKEDVIIGFQKNKLSEILKI